MASTGDRIREIREKRGMTQEQLANEANISKGFLSDVENNKRNIGSERLLRIADILGASVDYLLKGEVAEFIENKAVTIPSTLSQAAEELQLPYTETLELLLAYESVVARRSNEKIKEFTVEDWKKLHKAIKGVFG